MISKAAESPTVLAVLAVLSMGGLRDVPNVKSAYKCQEAFRVRLEMRMSLTG